MIKYLCCSQGIFELCLSESIDFSALVTGRKTQYRLTPFQSISETDSIFFGTDGRPHKSFSLSARPFHQPQQHHHASSGSERIAPSEKRNGTNVASRFQDCYKFEKMINDTR